MRSSRYEARGKFGEHERCVRVAGGALQTSQVLHILTNLQLMHEPIVLLFYNIFTPMENFFLEGFVC